MIGSILKSSLQFRFLVVTLAAVAMVVGFANIRAMPADVLPEYAPAYVEVQTESLGLSADEVESLVTLNLEELLQGIPWLQTMRSQSVPGLSSIMLIFEPGTDINRARQVVQERLTLAHMLPNVSSVPMVLQPLSATSRVMVIGLSSTEVSAIEMSVLARWKIRPALTSLSGVANVSIWGQRERQLQVRVDPELLRAYGISLDQIIRTTGDALWVSPLSFLAASTPGTGGWIDTPQQRLEIRHVLPIGSAEDLARVPIYGSTLHLGDVAHVVEDHQPLIGEAVRDTGPNLLLVVEKFPGANTLEVTRGVEATLNAMRPGLAGVDIDTTILRPATLIELGMANLGIALLIGLGLVALALLAMMLHLRVALVSIVAILLSLTAAALVLHFRGATLNAMTFAGLMIALAVIVDDAVVDPENIARRLRQHGRDTGGQSAPNVMLAVLAASAAIRRPMVFAAAIAVLAVVPAFLFRGVSGALIQPLALSYALAVGASLVVALTVTPALSLILLSKAPPSGDAPLLVRWLERAYAGILARTIAMRLFAYMTVAILLVAGVGVLAFAEVRSLAPSFQERQLLIQWEGAPGASHPEMTRITTEVSRELGTISGVSNVGAHVGRAVLGDEVVGINSAKIWVTIAPSADYSGTVAAIQEVVDRYPGLVREVRGYVEGSIGEALAGSTRDMVVRVFGPEWETLRTTAQTVSEAISRIDGVVDLETEAQVEEPTVEVEVDLAKAEQYGVKPGDVRRAASTLVNGLPVGLLFEEQKIFDVVVWSKPESRDSLTDIREMLIDTPSGARVQLEDVADIRIVPALTTINREAVSRRIDVSFNVQGRDAAAVARDVEVALRVQSFPLEYHGELLGEYAERQADLQRILIAAIIAALAIFLILQAAFQNWRLAALAFLTLPCVLVGGLLAAAIADGGNLSIGSLGGLFAVLAIAIRHNIMLITRFQWLEEQEDPERGSARAMLVARGAVDRVGPILTTVLAMSLALVPVLLFGNAVGFEIWHPMAIVIVGGLITSTALNLFVVPTLYLRIVSPSTFAATPQPGPAPVRAVA